MASSAIFLTVYSFNSSLEIELSEVFTYKLGIQQAYQGLTPSSKPY